MKSNEQVKKHNKQGDLWVVFNGIVYDISSYATVHPGGLDILVQNGGSDVTKLYSTYYHRSIPFICKCRKIDRKMYYWKIVKLKQESNFL